MEIKFGLNNYNHNEKPNLKNKQIAQKHHIWR